MNTEEKIALAKENIKNAIRDYGLHTTSNAIFIERLARDSVYAKAPLREMFRKFDALVINGAGTHNPDYELINPVTRSMPGSVYDLG